MNYCYQVEEFVNNECVYDRLFQTPIGADGAYDRKLKEIRKRTKLVCVTARGRGSEPEERLHIEENNDTTFLRLTVRKIQP